MGYHEGLSPYDRINIEKDWLAGEFPVIIVAGSFGKGIHKSSIRFVVHCDVPQGIANYYQVKYSLNSINSL